MFLCVCFLEALSYTKIRAEALSLCGTVARSLRSSSASAASAPTLSAASQSLLAQLFAGVHAQLQLQDVEQEVKEAAVAATAALLSAFSDVLPAPQVQCVCVRVRARQMIYTWLWGSAKVFLGEHWCVECIRSSHDVYARGSMISRVEHSHSRAT
jgi:hypothetical protein